MKIGNQTACGDKEERLLKTVLALFKAKPILQVLEQYNICRRKLDKFKRGALTAITLPLASFTPFR